MGLTVCHSRPTAVQTVLQLPVAYELTLEQDTAQLFEIHVANMS